MDLVHKESSSGEDGKKMEKCCSDCKTTKTPLWRVGPTGPKSLCNACGIRFRKKRSELGVNKGIEKKKEKSRSSNPAAVITESTTAVITESTAAMITEPASAPEDSDLCESVKMGLMALGKEVLLQRSSSESPSPSPSPRSPASWFSSPVKRQRSRRRSREEEQAAILLLSLSCGSVSA